MSFSDVDTGLPNYPDLIPGYTPYIGDSSQLPAEPFVIPFVDNRSDEEIDLIRHSLRPIIQKTEFDSPIPVADFCLVAIQRWEDDDDIQIPKFLYIFVKYSECFKWQYVNNLFLLH